MSEVKVNKISPRTACGTVTLGDSGDTFTIPSGATITNAGTASGFGATGETSWDTTVKTTGTFTATAGVGYFLNTTGGIITVNLPAGAAGSSVAMVDYAATWQTSNVTVSPNGAEKIGAIAEDAVLNTEGQSVTFVYVDGTQGWVNVIDSTSNVRGTPPFVAATGGCITTTGDYKIHTFFGPGTLCVSAAGLAPGSNTVDYMVVAGGGGGGGHGAGGGGAGGFRESPGTASGCYTASPRGAAPAVALSVPVAPYSIVVGGGGPGGCCSGGTIGSDSSFSTITSTGGGYGGGGIPAVPTTPAGAGGSGGGGGAGPAPTPGPGAAGNTPPFNPVQGMAGGNSAHPQYAAGGGGGALAVGAAGVGGSTGGAGGIGAGTAINLTTMPAPSPTPSAQIGTPGPSPSVRYFSGGGGGSIQPTGGNTNGAGGAGGGGEGIFQTPCAGPICGTINTGGGGGGLHGCGPGAGIGGSGIVVIRYKFQ